jgi:hypothetical protein
MSLAVGTVFTFCASKAPGWNLGALCATSKRPPRIDVVLGK